MLSHSNQSIPEANTLFLLFLVHFHIVIKSPVGHSTYGQPHTLLFVIDIDMPLEIVVTYNVFGVLFFSSAPIGITSVLY